MKDRIPHSELLLVPNANHSVHLEKNEIVLTAIRKFLQDHPITESEATATHPDIRISIGIYPIPLGTLFATD
jgi:hypothetical protein